MNWNGHAKNNVLGNISACRESIAATKERGMSSDEAMWLLDKVNPEQNHSAIISLIAPLSQWCDSVPEDEREKWLVRMMIDRPIEIRLWMGYAPDWTMMPAAVCKRFKEVVRLAQGSGLPRLYLLPATPRQSDIDKVGPITLDINWVVTGIQLETVTYMLREGGWYKVYYPKLPSQSAVSRAMRLYLLGVLLGRQVDTTKDLFMYELTGIKSWLLYGEEWENGIAKHAANTLFHLLAEPEIEGQVNGRH